MSLKIIFVFFYLYGILNSKHCYGIRILKNRQIWSTSGLPFLMHDSLSGDNKKIITLSQEDLEGFIYLDSVDL